MKKWIQYLVIVGLAPLLSSCIGGSSIPAGVIPEETMVLILTDIHLLEGSFFSTQTLNQDSALTVTYRGYRTVFNKYKVTPEQYKKSYKFYLSHPEFSDRMYEQVVENISILQTEGLKAQKKKQK